MPAHTVDLEPHRAWIVAEVQAGRTLDYICSHLPVHGSCSVSTRTLKRRLDAWGIRNQETGENGERRRTRREAGLGQAKPTIIDLYVQGRPMKAIQAEVRRQSGIQLSERRLHSLLHEWEVPPRRERAHAPEVHEVVATLAQDGLPVSQIRRYLEVELQVHRSASWVLRLLQSMAIPPPRFWDVAHVSDEDAPAIMGYIADTFYESKQTDSDVQDQLEAMGFRVSLRQIFVFRKQMGLFRKLHRQQADDSLEQLRQFLVDSPRADLLAPRLTKKLLPVFFKQEFKLSISRAMAWRFMQEHYAADMLERIRHLARRRSGFLCPGPNYIWSIDAYCKLQHWGFEVYACIDAYSRYIVWAHVGHTSQTQRSVCLQYVDVVRERGFLPLIIRSDHGVETGMIAGAHYWLSAASTERRLLKPTRDEDGNVVWIYREMQGDMEVRQVVHAGEGQDVPPPRFGPWRQLEFHECYSYGVSTKNQRIESWWQQLNYHVSGLWRDYFTYLEKNQEWSEFRIADRIAVLYIYLPQIHWEVGKFVDAWNSHTIRAQRNRPHIVPGIPLHNFRGRDTSTRVNCAVTPDPETLAKLEEALEHDRENVSRYLPQDVMLLCESMMHTLDLEALPEPVTGKPLIHVYRHLRACLQRHEGLQLSPILRLAEKPTGGWPALDAVVQETGRSLADILGEDIQDDIDPRLDL